jgi:hypothetical protein
MSNPSTLKFLLLTISTIFYYELFNSSRFPHNSRNIIHPPPCHKDYNFTSEKTIANIENYLLYFYFKENYKKLKESKKINILVFNEF